MRDPIFRNYEFVALKHLFSNTRVRQAEKEIVYLRMLRHVQSSPVFKVSKSYKRPSNAFLLVFSLVQSTIHLCG